MTPEGVNQLLIIIRQAHLHHKKHNETAHWHLSRVETRCFKWNQCHEFTNGTRALNQGESGMNS